jgi:hypothetical protein
VQLDAPVPRAHSAVAEDQSTGLPVAQNPLREWRNVASDGTAFELTRPQIREIIEYAQPGHAFLVTFTCGIETD